MKFVAKLLLQIPSFHAKELHNERNRVQKLEEILYCLLIYFHR